jgi:hypothetical protein
VGVPREGGVEHSGEEKECAGAECDVGIEGCELNATQWIEAIDKEHAHIEFDNKLEHLEILGRRGEDAQCRQYVEDIDDEGYDAKRAHLDMMNGFVVGQVHCAGGCGRGQSAFDFERGRVILC